MPADEVDYEKLIREVVLKGHTERCHKDLVGGKRPSCPDHPAYWRGVQEVWSCSDDCGVKNRKQERASRMIVNKEEPHKEGMYTVDVVCGNCFHGFSISIQKGKMAGDQECVTCGCIGLRVQPRPTL